MTRYLRSLILTGSLLLFFTATFAQGYNITVTIEGVKDTAIFLANHYGDKQYLKDTAQVNSKGVAVFKGKETFPGGIYMVVMPDKSYFEIIMDEKQHFSVETKKADPVNNMKVKGSVENQVFYDDLKYINSQRAKYESLREKKAQETDPKAIAALDQQMKAIDEEVKKHRSKLMATHPGLFYTKLLKAMEEPVIPDNPNPSDSLFAYRYYKAHFFDNLDFSDARLLYSPAYHQKMNRYLKQLTYQDPDSLIVSIDYILDKAKADPEIYKYTLAQLLNEHAASKIMGMDAIYVHLAENYYMKGEADWVDEKQLESIRNDAMKLKPFLIGKKIPNIEMRDEYGKWRSLYGLESDYTILYIWDADCGHCRTTTPQVKALYDKVRDKNVEVFAVSIEYTLEHWDEFIKEHDLDWINLIDTTGETNFRSVYRINSTPVVYLLDKDKKIVAKRLDPENLEKLLEHLINNDQPFSDQVTIDK